MNKFIIILIGLLIVGGCSPSSEVDRRNSVAEPTPQSDQLPITKSLNDQAKQLRKNSRVLQALLDKRETQQ